MVVQDIDRPDINGTPPKMSEIAQMIKRRLKRLPYVKVHTDDNLCSSITIRGALDSPEQWRNGIFENGKSFLIIIMPEKRKRYYESGDKITAEVRMNRLGKFRKSTASPERIVQRINEWINLQTSNE